MIIGFVPLICRSSRKREKEMSKFLFPYFISNFHIMNRNDSLSTEQMKDKELNESFISLQFISYRST